MFLLFEFEFLRFMFTVSPLNILEIFACFVSLYIFAQFTMMYMFEL